MTDHKFTDEQIIRCLNECYGKEYIVAHIVDRGEEAFVSLAMILDIINRQKAEIEAKEEEYADMLGQRNAVEIKLENIRTETIKFFAERLKDSLTGWETEPTDEEIEYTIDNLVKKILEENK